MVNNNNYGQYNQAQYNYQMGAYNQTGGDMNYQNGMYNQTVNDMNYQYGAYDQSNITYDNLSYGQYAQQNEVTNYSVESKSFKDFINVGMILTIISAIVILIGFLMPAMDFSYFHPEVDIQYNISKICKNVRLISPVWTALPVGIIIGIMLLFILSFVRIPQFRLIPCILIISMFVIMLVDMNNIIVWADDIINSEVMQDIVNQEILINKTEVFKSLQPGVYMMVAGTILGIISSFIPPRKTIS